MWLQIEMDKIDYFGSLSLSTKQELILGMVRLTFEKGSLLISRGQVANNLILINEGLVEVSVKYDRRRPGDYFVIERLGRGAIINYRSFMVADDADTDFVCLNTVSVFVLPYKKFEEVRAKRQDLQQAKANVELQLLRTPPLALDYIFHNNERSSIETYREQLRKNNLRVKFKNAIMAKWSAVKELNQPGNISEMVDQMLKKKRDAASDSDNAAK